MKRNPQIGVLLEIGDTKEVNQDSTLSKFEVINKYEVGLFVVADGMGGLAYGQEISNLVVTYFNRWWAETLCPFVDSKSFNSSKIDRLLQEAIVEINSLAVSFGKQVDKKVGSTLSLLLVIGKQYFIKNIGDSRIYLIRKNTKLQLTEDQSLVAEMLRAGKITKEEARTHNKRNVLTMCLGVFEEVKTYSAAGAIESCDVFLLCSDGFYNFADEAAIIPVIGDSSYKDFNQKALALRSKIPAGKAKDNISIILIGFGDDSKFRSLKEHTLLHQILKRMGSLWS